MRKKNKKNNPLKEEQEIERNTVKKNKSRGEEQGKERNNVKKNKSREEEQEKEKEGEKILVIWWKERKAKFKLTQESYHASGNSIIKKSYLWFPKRKVL